MADTDPDDIEALLEQIESGKKYTLFTYFL